MQAGRQARPQAVSECTGSFRTPLRPDSVDSDPSPAWSYRSLSVWPPIPIGRDRLHTVPLPRVALKVN